MYTQLQEYKPVNAYRVRTLLRINKRPRLRAWIVDPRRERSDRIKWIIVWTLAIPLIGWIMAWGFLVFYDVLEYTMT